MTEPNRPAFNDRLPITCNPRKNLTPNGGQFVFDCETREPKRVKNTWVAQGGTLALRLLFRGEAVMPAAFYLGLSNAAYTFDTATIALLAAGEPVGNGYARIALTRNTTDWTVSEVNGVLLAQSKIVIFACTGSPWTQTYQRAFLCDQAAGTAGNIFAVSGPLPAPVSVLVGAAPSIRYEFWLRG